MAYKTVCLWLVKALIAGCIILSLFSGLQASAANSWIFQNPYPTANALLAVKFVTPQKGWVVGEKGIILHTKDGGENWEIQESGVWNDLTNVVFVNETTGWVVDKTGNIIKTENGGKNWILQKSIEASINKIFFLNKKEGWIVGDQGVLLYTDDGGKNWAQKPMRKELNIASVYFINSNVGWMLAGDTVLRTLNAGKTWDASSISSSFQKVKFYNANNMSESIEVPSTNKKGDIFFINEHSGWAVEGSGHIFRTTNGGKTWELQSKNTEAALQTISFFNEQKGCATGTDIFCTADAGKTWNKKTRKKSEYVTQSIFFHGLALSGNNVAYAVGSEGEIIKTLNAGDEWAVISKEIKKNTLTFVDEKTGFGFDKQINAILKTQDGGNTWQVVKKLEFNTYIPSGKFFVNAQTGWFGGLQVKKNSEGKKINYTFILSTNDGGNTWTTQYDKPGKSILEMYFSDQKHGWGVGEDGLILNTIDGGKHWVRQQSNSNFRLEGVFFINNHKGWVFGTHSQKTSGKESVILFTNDGGKKWQKKSMFSEKWICQILFINEKKGWLVAETPDENIVILLTNDGGNTWSEKYPKNLVAGPMTFINEKDGILLNEGVYAITSDGGMTWHVRRLFIRKNIWNILELFKDNK